jgi:hypothetical protein
MKMDLWFSNNSRARRRRAARAIPRISDGTSPAPMLALLPSPLSVPAISGAVIAAVWHSARHAEPHLEHQIQGDVDGSEQGWRDESRIRPRSNHCGLVTRQRETSTAESAGVEDTA